MNDLNNLDAEKALEWEKGWIPGRITVDECATVVDAEYRGDYRWNGWLCPRIKFDAAMEVLRAIAEVAPDQWIIMLDGEDFILYDLNDEGSGYEVEVHSPTEDGWYSPGYMGWCWELAWDIPAGTTVYVVDEDGATFALESAEEAEEFATRERQGGSTNVTTGPYVTRQNHATWDDVADEATAYFHTPSES